MVEQMTGTSSGWNATCTDPHLAAATDALEDARLHALQELDILDTALEQPFERIVSLVQQILKVPICAVSLVDRDRQWFKAQRGLSVCQTSRDVSFCTQAIMRNQPFVIPDALQDARFRDNPLVLGPPCIRAYAGIPLQTKAGFNMGSLCAIDTQPRVFTQSELGILISLAAMVVDELELRRVASTDHLTGALSRRAWSAHAAAEFSRAQRYGRPLALAMLDLDAFKCVNDAHGHAAGDRVIQHIARLSMSAIRQSDVFGRLGGEEFVLLMPETTAAEAMIVADRIRAAFAATPTDIGQPLLCTVSIGVAAVIAADTGLAALTERADKALYEAKTAGRNLTRLSARNSAAPIFSQA
jgi:diguanylate cyclase (GGDEF)-like protein